MDLHRPVLPVTIVDFLTLAADGDDVVEQLVFGRVDTSEMVAMFDYPARIERALKGKKCLMTLFAFLPDMELLTAEEYGIETWTEAVVPRIHNPAFSGRIVGFIGDDFILDVGCGTILVDHDLHTRVKKGDHVRVRAFRLDVYGKIQPYGWTSAGRRTSTA